MLQESLLSVTKSYTPSCHFQRFLGICSVVIASSRQHWQEVDGQALHAKIRLQKLMNNLIKKVNKHRSEYPDFADSWAQHLRH